MADIQVVKIKDFDRGLTRMSRLGGEKQRRARKVYEVLGRLDQGPEAFEGMKRTTHGENRIRGCVKYDLGGGYRLVTVQTKKLIGLCFVGDHDDCDSWIGKNTGLQLVRGAQGHWEPVYQSPSIDTPIRPAPQPSEKPLIELTDRDRLNRLLSDVPPVTVGKIANLAGVTPPVQIEEVCSEILDDDRRSLVYDVLCLLSCGDRRSAELRMDLAFGAAKPAEELTDDEMMLVGDGDQVRRIRVGSSEHAEWLERFARSAEFLDWLLFLHPEQQAVVDADFNGPSQLSGVSGSGKTCIAVHRALRMVQGSADSSVLIVTLNRSLAGMIDGLVKAAAPARSVPDRITVLSFFQLCQELLGEFEPRNHRLYRDVTWKLEEHIDEVFREFYRCWHNNDSANVLLPIHHSLIAQGINAESYIREEFDWIRSAVNSKERDRYLALQRSGRRVGISEDWRSRLLEGLLDWEAKMTDVGVIDYLGLTTAVSRHVEEIPARYDHVIVDEAQDFGTTELAVLRALCREGPNDMFLCGDIAQHVLPKHRTLSEAGINVSGRTRRVNRNYRNSREILEAAYEVLMQNLDDSMIESSDLEILDPEYANRSSNSPVVLRAESLTEEIGYARTLVKEHLEHHPGHRCCIAFAGYSMRDVSRFAENLDLPALHGDAPPSQASLVVSDLEQTKGYEFNLVVIVNCNRDVLPPSDEPKEEAFRHGCRLYVSMTRARDELVLSYHDQPSPWLTGLADVLTQEDWQEMVQLDPALVCGEPERLPQLEDASRGQVLRLKGRDFLYSPEALGLSLEAIRKIDELVDGRGLRSGGYRVRWRSMADLRTDLETEPRARTIFGPVVQQEIRDRLAAFD